MKNDAPKIRGEGAYAGVMQLLTMIQRQGLVRTMSGIAAELLIMLLAYAWKARLVLHWRLSPLVTQEKYNARQATCAKCDSIEKVDGGAYCKSCGCGHWRWSELSAKNQREGHNCPLGKHDGSKERGCSNCGGVNPDAPFADPGGDNGRAHELEVARLARERVKKIRELESQSRLK